MKKATLDKAKRNKRDEFYTQMQDIEQELVNYRQHFRGKVVYCNCDDPRSSNFVRFFQREFRSYGLKKLIATCYKDRQFDLFGNYEPERSLYLEYEGTAADLKYLRGDGDFRSAECIRFLQESDIVVTNPPFSLFRQYVRQLVAYDKQFLILGNPNATSYTEVFSLFRQNRIWFGVTAFGNNMEFRVPDRYVHTAESLRIDERGRKYIGVPVRWFTNLSHSNPRPRLELTERYSPDRYPHYDNYDAIEVSNVKDIPVDWGDAMGVPITFFDRYNPDQFELLGMPEAYGRGSSNGLWEPLIGARHALINGARTFTRVFVRLRRASSNLTTNNTMRKTPIRYKTGHDPAESGGAAYVQLTAPKGSWYFHHFCMKPDEQDAVVHIFRRYADGQMSLSWWDTFAPHVTHVLTQAFQRGAPVVISAGDPTDEDAVLAAVKAEVRRFYRIVLRMRQSDASALPDQSAKDIVRAVTEPKGDSDWERKAKEDGWDGYSDYEPDPDPPVEPFTYEGDEAYFDIPAVNASSLKKIKKSALHYWQEYRNPDRPEYVPSKSMQLGTCLHGLVLENKRVWKTVPDISQSTNLGKCVSALVLGGKRIWVVPPDDVGGPRSLAYKEWKKGVPKDAIILRPEAQAEVFQVYGDIPESERRTDLPDDAPQLTHKEIAQVEGMADSILRHPRASELVANVETEVMLNWKYKLDLDGEQIPVICKGLLDALVPGMGDRPLTIMDIKTAADGSPDAFMRSVAAYNYHIQAAFYRDGLFAQTGDRDIEFVFVVVESAPPYAVGVYLLEPLAIDQGRREYVKALKVYHRCLAAEAEQAGDDPDLRSAWPAYEAPGIGLPRWAWDAHTWKLYNE